MTNEQIYALHLQLQGLDKKAAKARREAFAAAHKVSENAVAKRLRRYRKARVGARPPRIAPELEAAVRTVWEYKHTKDGQLSTERAQELAFSEGEIPRTFALSSLNQVARRLGLNPQAEYVRRMEATYSNQAHRVDVSGSRHFRIVEQLDGDDWMVEVVRKEQRNKRWRDGDLLWIVCLVDDYSRVMNARYVVALGESAAMVQRFCVDTWRTGPPQGMPEEYLLCDQGAFGKEASTRALLEFFGIELITGQPENSRRNGRVERIFRPFKEDFERSYLKTHGTAKRMRLSQLTEELRVFTVKLNERRHPIRRDRSKLEDWKRGLGFRGITECPEDALHMAVYRQPRKVTAEGGVQHDNRLLEIIGLPHGLLGREVTLVYNRQRELVAEHDGTSYPVRPLRSTALGNYESEAERGRTAPPAAEIAKAAARRPSTGVGAFSRERHSVLRAKGVEPTAPGMPVRQDGAPDRVITPPARLRPREEWPDPFTAARAYRTLEEAKRRLGEILTLPLHMALPREAQQRVEAALRECGLDKAKTETLGNKLKQAIGI